MPGNRFKGKSIDLVMNENALDSIMKGEEVGALVAGKAEEAASIAAAIYTDSKGQTTYDVLGPEVNQKNRRVRAAVIVRSPAYPQRVEGRKAAAQAVEAVTDEFIRKA